MPGRHQGGATGRFASRVLAAAGLALVATLTSCVGGPPPSSLDPDWVTMPHSWSRLEVIERWLDSSGASDDPRLRLDAELELAEGRLGFALDDLRADPRARVHSRLDAAAAGFRRVTRSSVASDSHLRRAESGLAEVERARTQGSRSGSTVDSSYRVGQFRARSTWRPEPADTRNMDRASGVWSRLTVHHTNMEGIPAPRAGAGEADNAAYMRRLQRAHQLNNGWADLGYQFVIDADGRLWEGRGLDYVGAHAGRRGGRNNNLENIGISLMGNFEHASPTQAALRTLSSTLDSFRTRYGIARTAVYGHREFKNTACPGDVLMRWVSSYRGGAASTIPSNSASSGTRGTKPRISSLEGSPTIRSTDEVDPFELLFGDASAGSSTAR